MTTNITRNLARYVALPFVSAGIIGAAALGMAGMANASTPPGSQGTNHSYAPHVKAHPAPGALPGWHHNHGVWRVERLQPGYHR